MNHQWLANNIAWIQTEAITKKDNVRTLIHYRELNQQIDS